MNKDKIQILIVILVVFSIFTFIVALAYIDHIAYLGRFYLEKHAREHPIDIETMGIWVRVNGTPTYVKPLYPTLNSTYSIRGDP